MTWSIHFILYRSLQSTALYTFKRNTLAVYIVSKGKECALFNMIQNKNLNQNPNLKKRCVVKSELDTLMQTKTKTTHSVIVYVRPLEKTTLCVTFHILTHRLRFFFLYTSNTLIYSHKLVVLDSIENDSFLCCKSALNLF